MLGEFLHQLAKSLLVHPRGDAADSGGKRRIGARAPQDTVARRLQVLGGCALVHHLEVRGNAAFDGEARQQGFAERVNGHDLEPAGRIQHFRE